MLQNETLPLWALSVGVVVPLVAVVAVCVCGCKKTVPKNELLGLAGMVKITNPEESLNHNHQSNESSTCTVVGSGRACLDATDSNRRTSSTVNRSLPAIPNDPERLRLEGGDPIWEMEPNGDTSSELYATVEENKHVVQPLVPGHGMAGASKRVSALNSQPDESKSSNTDDGFNLYACLKAEHPYDKLRKGEHAYAQVRSSSQGAAEGSSNEPGPSRVSLRAEEVSCAGSGGAPSISSEASFSTSNPVPPPRTRKSSSHSSLLAVAAATQLPGSVPDIPAATAIAGHISANQELPYMTPPIPTSTNFSGDSQDSKGYTSISVREPLANIKAQTKASNQRSRAQELVDSHYATVSDDSDELYAAIEEPSQVYTSGSETYAQIQPQPTPVPEPQPLPVPVAEPYIPPQPPSVDSLKHVAQAHSRQASSSSATSSVANLGSPKPEKRQANSPLPPPPAGSPELYASVDKKCLLFPNDVVGGINLEEMYAKVLKKKQHNIESEAMDDVLNSATRTPVDGLSNISVETTASHECLRREADGVSVCSIELAQDMRLDYSSHDTSPVQSNGELYCGYEKLHSSDGKHSRELHVSESDYESVGAHNLKCDPGYEVVQQLQRNPSDADPNYEELRPQPTLTDTTDLHCDDGSDKGEEKCSASVSRTLSDGDPGYEKVHSSAMRTSGEGNIEAMAVFSDDGSEPNYESMPSEGPEHNYAGVLGATGGSESDPNYEMVEHEDPNYESVNYFEVNSDPPYERLRNEEIRDSDNDTAPGYEQVRHQGNNSTLGYEHFKKESTEKPQKQKRNNEPGYEEVGRKQKGSTIDVWKVGEQSIYNQNSNISAALQFLETSSKQNDDQHHHVTEQTDRLYSQVQKSHTKM